jgi:hypothetical protein
MKSKSRAGLKDRDEKNAVRSWRVGGNGSAMADLITRTRGVTEFSGHSSTAARLLTRFTRRVVLILCFVGNTFYRTS